MDTIARLQRGYLDAREAQDKDKMDRYASAIRSYQESQEQDGFNAFKMVGNIPSSAAGVASDMANVVMHPIDTAKAVGNLALGGAQKLIPGEQDSEKYADAFGQMMVERYGSVENALSTLQNDPAGFMGDLSSVLIPAGGAVKAIPGMSRAGEAIQRGGSLVEPFNILKQGVQAGRVLPDDIPRKLYESSAKFSTTLTPEQRAVVVETGLKNRLTPTRAGVEKGNIILSDLDTKIDEMVAAADASGEMIPKSRLFRYLNESRRKFGGAKLDAADDLQRIDDVARKFDEHLTASGKENLTPSEVQDFKKAVYSRINYDREASRTREATEHAQKGMARAAKEEMEMLSPEIKDVNRNWGEMREWLDNAERSAGRIENRDIMGIGVPIKMGAGAAAGGETGLMAGLVQGILDSPTMKARLAIGMRELKDSGLKNPLSSAAIRDVLFQAGREQEEQGLLY